MRARHRTYASARCEHSKYWLSCTEADALYSMRGARCWLCEREEEPDRSVLTYDHDPEVGPWAVRGLLCRRCNVHLLKDSVVPAERRQAYMAAAWWLANRSPVFLHDAASVLDQRVRAALVRGSNPEWVRQRFGVTRTYIGERMDTSGPHP